MKQNQKELSDCAVQCVIARPAPLPCYILILHGENRSLSRLLSRLSIDKITVKANGTSLDWAEVFEILFFPFGEHSSVCAPYGKMLLHY